MQRDLGRDEHHRDDGDLERDQLHALVEQQQPGQPGGRDPGAAAEHPGFLAPQVDLGGGPVDVGRGLVQPGLRPGLGRHQHLLGPGQDVRVDRQQAVCLQHGDA